MMGVAFALLGMTLSGYALMRPFLRDLSNAERFAWSVAAGLIAQAALVLLLIGARPGADFSAPAALLTALLLVPLLRSRWSAWQEPPRPRPSSGVARVLIATAAAGVALFAIAAVSEPMWTIDYLAIWGLKAKTIFLTASLLGRLFHDPATVWSHPEYPILLPLDLAALAAWARGWDDRALALLYPLWQMATAAAAFGFLARRGRPFGGAIAATLIAWFFPLYASANVGTADIPLAFGFVLLASALLDAMETDALPVRARLAGASLFCATLKQEGALFAVLAAVVWLVFPQAGARRGGVFAALALPPILHGALLQFARGPVPGRIFDFGLLAPGRWREWGGRLWQAASHVAGVEMAAGAIPLAALAGFLFLTRRGATDRLLPLLGGQAFVYVVACSLSVIGVVWHLEASFSRTTCALFPVLALVLGARVTTADG